MGLIRPIRQGEQTVAVDVTREPEGRFPETTMAKERSKAYEAVGEIMKLHRASESNARWAAVRTALRLRDSGTRKLAEDRGFLEGIARQFQVHEFHLGLFVDITQCLCQLLPVGHDEAREEILAAWRLMDSERG